MVVVEEVVEVVVVVVEGMVVTSVARVVTGQRSALREVVAVVEEGEEEVLVMDVSNVARLDISPGSVLRGVEGRGEGGDLKLFSSKTLELFN